MAASDSSSHTSTSVTSKNNTDQYLKRSCQVYESCKGVDFDPQVSTVITEWGLTCDKASYSSVIISVQMAGVFIGSFVSGHLGDLIGRKKTLYGSVACMCVLNFLTILSPTWQVFALMRFLLGLTVAGNVSLAYVLPSEFIDDKWRARMASLPAWNVGGMVFTTVAMVFQDWKYLHICSGIAGLLSLLSVIWTPESLRWLEINNKTKEFEKVGKKIISLNKKRKLNIEDYTGKIVMDSSIDEETLTDEHETMHKKTYSTVDIFRKGYRINSCIIGFNWLSMSLVYYAISFGVKSLYGNIYINLFIMFSLAIPFTVFPFFLPNLVGRKKSSIIFYSMAGVCLLTATGLEVWASKETRATGTFVLAMAARLCMTGSWASNSALTAEMYPTCCRSIGIGYGSLMARMGGILAPFLIPKTSETLYICYLVMGVILITCCLLMLKLPETKGKKLKETFEDDDLS